MSIKGNLRAIFLLNKWFKSLTFDLSKHLNDPYHLKHGTLTFQPSVEIASYTQSTSGLGTFGSYIKAEWKPDSTALAVMVE